MTIVVAGRFELRSEAGASVARVRRELPSKAGAGVPSVVAVRPGLPGKAGART
jgi:hypothetical protein